MKSNGQMGFLTSSAQIAQMDITGILKIKIAHHVTNGLRIALLVILMREVLSAKHAQMMTKM